MARNALIDAWVIPNKSVHLLSSNLVRSMAILILF